MLFDLELAAVLRRSLQRPGFIALGSVALGVGLAAALLVVAALDTLVWRDVPGVREPQRQLELGRRVEHGFDSLSLADFEDIRRQSRLLDKVYAWRMTGAYLGRDDRARSTLAMLVSEDYFAALGARAAIGRLFGGDDELYSQPVVVATRKGFEQWFGGDEAAIGQPVRVNGVALTLIGVLEDDFQGHGTVVLPSVFVPFRLAPELHVVDRETLATRTANWFHAGARLAAGASITQAQQELDRIAASVRERFADTHSQFQLGLAALKPLPFSARGPLQAMALGLLCLCLAVLAMACSNLSGILLARGEARSAEFAMRSALGASRRRLIAQLMVETLPVLVAALALAALLLSWARRALIEAQLPIPVPLVLEFQFGWNALLAALLASLLMALAMGWLPAWRLSRSALAHQLGGLGTGTVADGQRTRLLLLAAQSALTMLLLMVASLTLRGLDRAASIDTGFQLHGVYTSEVDLQPLGVAGAASAEVLQRITDDLRQRGAIEDVSYASVLPLTLNRKGFGSAYALAAPEQPLSFDGNLVGDRFFSTLGIAVHGRAITAADSRRTQAVAVINRTFATELFGAADPIGGRFSVGVGEQARSVEVIGVVADGRYAHRGDSGRSFAFFAAGQWPEQSFHLFVRSPAGAEHVRTLVGESLRALRPDLPEPAVLSFEQVSMLSILPQRIMASTAGALGGLSLLLAATGLYALLALQFERRIAEFGLRQALGARPADIARALILPSLRWCLGGAALGLLLGQLLGLALGSLLFEVSPLDPPALLATLACLLGVIAVASIRPLRRAMRLPPMTALRQH